jgi:hypothetical protein
MEGAMWRRMAAISFGFLLAAGIGALLLIGTGTGAADTGRATFKLTNKADYVIMVKFFSQTRNWQWPAPGKHYNLDDSEQHEFRLSCQSGEKICYGGSETASDKTHWGVGYKGDKACAGCCITCGGTHSWNLTKAPSYTCAHCNDGSCQCGVGTPGSLCSAHRGNDPGIGCTQQQ